MQFAEAPKPRGQLCPFLIAIELFYHPNNFASDARNVINEPELVAVNWPSLVILNCRLPGYYILFVHISVISY